MEERVYRLRKGFQVFCWVMAVLCFALVVLAPMGAMMIWILFHAEIRITTSHLIIKWFGTRTIPWSEIASLAPVRAQGAVGAMMMPHQYTLRSGKSGNIAVGAHDGTEEILAEIRKRIA
jgi:hypothetical protein